MTRRPRRWKAWFLAFVPAMGVPIAVAGAPPQLIQGSLTSAEVCGRCHRDIVEAWKSSVHSRSIEDPAFQDCLEEARKQFGDSVQARCWSCHAPTVAFSGDTGLVTKVSWEGVTCDFCHSISQVDLRNPDRPFRLQIGFTKFGPLKDAFSQAHSVTFSSAHTNPELCAGCHESRNSHGLFVLSTYSEWRDSSYAKDRESCLNCHMSPVKAQIVDPRVSHRKSGTVNFHQMPGGHSIEQLNKALSAHVLTGRKDGQLEVKVIVRNRGAGHSVPTGSPLRKLVMSMEVHASDGRTLTAERIYQRLIVDAAGKLLSDEPGVWVKGAKVASDNRLKANEERVETFTFDLPRAQSARITTRFWYHYSPLATQYTKKVGFLTLPSISLSR